MSVSGNCLFLRGILYLLMKTKAILMTIAMMSATLSGCTGSDGVAEIDDATLQELFDDE